MIVSLHGRAGAIPPTLISRSFPSSFSSEKEESSRNVFWKFLTDRKILRGKEEREVRIEDFIFLSSKSGERTTGEKRSCGIGAELVPRVDELERLTYTFQLQIKYWPPQERVLLERLSRLRTCKCKYIGCHQILPPPLPFFA